MLQLTSLEESTNQCLITFPESKILIDVGWTENLSLDLNQLVELAPSIDLILLTHATISHLGAYAYMCKISPEFSQIPVYATLPVINMGRMVTLDSYRSAGLIGPFLDIQMTIADVEAAFDHITSLKYSQSTSLFGKLEGMTITAYNAGHSLGGTIWKIQQEQEHIIYAVDWNHSRDSHLNGCFLQQNGKVIEGLERPTVMICGAKIPESSSPLKRRSEQLLKDIHATIDRGGTVLIPTSSGSRVLELCHILESYWASNANHLSKIPLLYYSHVGARTLSYASSMIEWMSSAIIDDWQVKNNSPFETKHFKVVNDLAELTKLQNAPKVILASAEAIEAGFSRELFVQLCQDERTTVILTERHPGTLNNELYDLWLASSGGGSSAVPLTTTLRISYNVEEPLQGQDLNEYNEKIREEKRKLELQNAIELRNRNILEQEEDEYSSDEEEDDDEYLLSGQIDSGILVYGNDVYDYDVRNAKGKNRMFPYVAKRQRVDDYGELIKKDEFVKVKENEPSNGGAVNDTENDKHEEENDLETTTLGLKRKWGQQYNDETFKLDGMSTSAVPLKIVKTETQLKVLCNVDFVDFEGLSDDRSLEMIIPLVQPKQLVFVPSIGRNIKELVNSLKESGVEEIVEAIEKVPVSLQIGVNVLSIKISPDLEKLLVWQQILGQYSVAHVTGKVHKEENQQNGGSSEMSLVPLKTAKELSMAPRSDPLMVGDIKLAELKRKLISMGHNTEFGAEGILVCDNLVAIRKLSEGRLIIEGTVRREFYEIKQVVQSLLATI